MNLGNKIKQHRKLLQLTQEQVADRCELTKGYISLLENDKTSPSIETLTHILNVLGTSLSEFFHEENQPEVVFEVEKQYVKDFGAYKQTWLVPSSQMQSMEPILVELLPNSQTNIDMPHEGEEFGYVIDGEIEVHYGKESYKCITNESFYILTNKSHFVVNNSKKIAKIVWVSCPPNF